MHSAYCDEKDNCWGCKDGYKLKYWTFSNSCDPFHFPGVLKCDVTRIVNKQEICVSCMSGYSLSSQGNACLSESFGCEQLDDGAIGRCRICRSGYYITNNKICLPSPYPKFSIWLPPFWIRILFALVVFLIVFRSRLGCRKSSRTNRIAI